MRALIGLAAGLLAAGAASAQTTVYTTQAAFEAAVASGSYLEDFASVGGGPITMLTFGPVGGFAYTLTADPGDLFNDPGLISTDGSDAKIVVTFTGAPVTAVGGNFWATDINFQAIPADVTIALSNGDTETFPATSASDFRGFTTTSPITSITIDAADIPVNAWATMDNLRVGTAASSGCYPDCDTSGTLNIFDYICFGNAYAAQQAYADCDGSGTFNIFDYICFGNAYAAGCP